MIQELDTVVLAHDIEEHGLSTGDIGAVVLSHSDGEAFEVEFVTGEGQTVAVLTLRAQEIRPMQAHEILHARQLAA
ncbi:MAG: DUF4926 domain-containing protein [Thermodesulfobacteriota bacterium]